VVKELDANPAVDETVYVYRLRNSQAANIEGVLNSLFNGTAPPSRSTQTNADVLRSSRTSNSSGSNSRASSRGGGGTIGSTGAFGSNTGNNRTLEQNNQQFSGSNRVSQAAQDLAGSLSGQVSIIADTDSNSLIVRTAPANYERVKQVLGELDKPVAQVLIKVLIAEVTHDNGYDFGTEMSVLNLRADGTAGQRGGSRFNVPVTGASATGLVVQILETNFTATIRALETSGKLDVLSRPYILASDNQLASITVGQEVPFITNSRITDTGQTINTIEYSDVGILLDVIPHINPDGLVILDVAPEISALTGTTVPISDTVSAPVIAKRSAQSRVGVRNGQTIVIGGLMEDRVTKSISKIPLLGDIPLIGELFKRTQDNKSKTELLIFLTPHVAAQPDMLEQMSNDETQGTRLVPSAVEQAFTRNIRKACVVAATRRRHNLHRQRSRNDSIQQTPLRGHPARDYCFKAAGGTPTLQGRRCQQSHPHRLRLDHARLYACKTVAPAGAGCRNVFAHRAHQQHRSVRHADARYLRRVSAVLCVAESAAEPTERAVFNRGRHERHPLCLPGFSAALHLQSQWDFPARSERPRHSV